MRHVTAVLVGPAQRASRAELCAFCGCRRTRSVVLLLCFASGLEVPQLRALSIAVGDSIAQARALLQPSCCTALTLLTPPTLCRRLDERYPTRCGGRWVVWHADFA